DELRRELAEQGIVMVIVRAKGLFRVWLKRAGLLDRFGPERIFYSIHSAVLAIQEVSNNAIEVNKDTTETTIKKPK
ncbi:hypothetical protein L0244_07265, partial [bacterium]|nr:hypothetical protein [bacterium]